MQVRYQAALRPEEAAILTMLHRLRQTMAAPQHFYLYLFFAKNII